MPGGSEPSALGLGLMGMTKIKIHIISPGFYWRRQNFDDPEKTRVYILECLGGIWEPEAKYSFANSQPKNIKGFDSLLITTNEGVYMIQSASMCLLSLISGLQQPVKAINK